MLRRCGIGVALAAVLLAFSGTAWSAPKPAKPGPTSKPAKSGPAIKTGTLVDVGVDSLNLTDEAIITKVVDALNAWTAKTAAAKADLKKQIDAIEAKIKEEKDKGKKNADQAKIKQWAEEEAKLPAPTEAAQYVSARDALKDILSADQLAKIDDAARARLVVTATKTFNTDVAKWADKGVKLTDEEKAKVEAVKARIKDEVAKPDMGLATPNAMSLGNKLAAEAKATLPQDKQDKLNPPKKKPTSAPDQSNKVTT